MDRYTSTYLLGPVAATICAAVIADIAPSTAIAAEPQKTISISECEVNGFGLGGSADDMQKAFGTPDSSLEIKPALDEYSHPEYQYDGIAIVFSMRGRSAMSYFVTSPEYRLRSGIGVGSTFAAVVQTLGPGAFRQQDGSFFLVYNVIEIGGDRAPAQLSFLLEDELVKSFAVTTPRMPRKRSNID